MKGKRTHCCEESTQCVLSGAHLSWHLSFAAWWTQEGHVTLEFQLYPFLSHIFPSHLILWTWWASSHGFGKAREGLGTAERSLLDQNIAVVWLCGRSMKHLMETVSTQRCAEVYNVKKGIRLRLTENEGFGLE